jgi:DNA mismatch repair protein MutL
MQKIQILDEKTINQIAAGEIIESGASIVKELVENAQDAAATSITVETKEGWIRISDNGCGMSEEDLLLAIERHATSKIREMRDLEQLTSFGFRGEALPSIASISKMKMHSCAAGAAFGHQIEIEGGRVMRLVPRPRAPGTTVEVHSLFYNVPVRRAFQKSFAQEWQELERIMHSFIFSNLLIEWRWIHESQLQCHFTQEEGLLVRMKQLLGEIADAMRPLNQTFAGGSLSGFISSPFLYRKQRRGQYLFLNGRTIHSPLVSRTISAAYGTRLPTHQFPLFILQMQLPPEKIDVNVHPQKSEVRFKEEEQVCSFLRDAVGKVLEGRSAPLPPMPFTPPLACEVVPLPTLITCSEERQYELPLPSTGKVLTLFSHFLIIEEREGLQIMDTRRARERILYEEMEKEEESGEIQSLLVPLSFSLERREARLLMERLLEFQKMGLGVRHFGGSSFLIDALPSYLKESEAVDFIKEGLEEKDAKGCKLRSCCTLKTGATSLAEAEALLQRLLKCENRDKTPAGKPITVQLTKEKLRELFEAAYKQSL